MGPSIRRFLLLSIKLLAETLLLFEVGVPEAVEGSEILVERDVTVR